MLAVARACEVLGLQGCIVNVEVDFNPRAGIPSFTLVGLPDNAVKESRERVRASIKNSNLQFPSKGYLVNLSPADMPKHSSGYDLAIAVGALAATDQIPLAGLDDAMFVGELSLDGSLRHVSGVLAMAWAAREHGLKRIYVAPEDAPQAALIDGIDVYPVPTLGHLVEHLYNLNPIPEFDRATLTFDTTPPQGMTDFAEIRGQEVIKRALEIAAAGNHNILMSGAPGSGKTLLARALPGIMPRLSFDEALEVTRIYSVADLLAADQPMVRERPFRAPHYTVSQAGLVGGGSIPKPGEVTLAHRGVLFLDEAAEFAGKTLEVLRQPIEDRIVTISRARGSLTYPANFLLVMAMNPCPCGYLGDPVKACTCNPQLIQRYQSRLSGPLLDRIELYMDVRRVEYDKLFSGEKSEPSADIRARVEAARERQRARFVATPALLANADMGISDIDRYCVLKSDAKDLLDTAVKRLNLSARVYHRILKVSRTIADIADCERIELPHVAEAVQYRQRQPAY
ncbi:MAG: YifB family Mg chelatase-like AAA ATPase [Chloroflexota bacterium]|nr:YifB family Mg chelatase-like AAA ATPase [Chloroflexota bacterium]